mmetsp:Transcript_6512/g.23134  ORF Transcript_6512/g.23134 Transcript_6512/m.23134 type:complete len:80 (-) Transcript_6512:63-302(-)
MFQNKIFKTCFDEQSFDGQTPSSVLLRPRRRIHHDVRELARREGKEAVQSKHLKGDDEIGWITVEAGEVVEQGEEICDV